MRRYIIGLVLLATPAFGGESGPLPTWVTNTKIGGEVFVDGYAMVAHDDELDIDVVSAFGVLKVNDKLKLLGRFDGMLDPNPDGGKIAYLPFDPTAKSRLFLVGGDVTSGPNISLIPNVAYVSYELPDDVTGETPDDDVLARVTLAWSF